MPEIEKVMGVSITDIEKVMGIEGGDIEKLMGLDFVTETPWHGTRAVGFGGNDGSAWNSSTDVIQYKAVTSAGDTSDFGDLSVVLGYMAAVSNQVRGICAGGQPSAGSGDTNEIQYVAIGTTGDTSDFGDLTSGIEQPSGAGNGTRALFGYRSTSDKQVDYITMGSTGNAADFGDKDRAMMNQASVNNSVRVLLAGGLAAGNSRYNEISYFTVASLGDATNFGDLSTAVSDSSGLESATRGCINLGSDGSAYHRRIDYVTVASTGDGADFGDMISNREGINTENGLSNLVRGEWWGGEGGTVDADDGIQYITIASTGNTTDAGNLTEGRRYGPACCSGQ